MEPRPDVTDHWTPGELPEPRKKEMKSSTWLLVRAAHFPFNSLFYVLGGGGSCLYLCFCAMCMPGACRSKERVSDPRELELETAVHPMGVLGIEPRSS